MTARVNQEQLDVLVALSQRMLDSAEGGDWESVNHLQQKIQQLSGELFSQVITTADTQAVTRAVNQVLKINKRIADMGLQARDLCLEEIGQLKQGRRAVKEYAENTR
jgi:translation initiation factor 2B subunit (eIF-2B alpha/beta/delta family)